MRRNRMKTRISLLAAWGLLTAGALGCDGAARGYCEANADCNRELIPGVPIPDAAGSGKDSVDVCVVNQTAQLRRFRANEEERCQDVAAAWDAYMACIAEEFAANEDGCDVLDDECRSELDDYGDALQSINGDECTENEE